MSSSFSRGCAVAAIGVAGLAATIVVPKLARAYSEWWWGGMADVKYYPKKLVEDGKTSTNELEYVLAHSEDFEDTIVLLEAHEVKMRGIRNSVATLLARLAPFQRLGDDNTISGVYTRLPVIPYINGIALFRYIGWERMLVGGAVVCFVSSLCLSTVLPSATNRWATRVSVACNVLATGGVAFNVCAAADAFVNGLLNQHRRLCLAITQVEQALVSWRATAVLRQRWALVANADVVHKLYHPAGTNVEDVRAYSEGTMGTKAEVDRHNQRMVYTAYQRGQTGYVDEYMAAVVQRVRYQCNIRQYSTINYAIVLQMVGRVMNEYGLTACDRLKKHAARLVIYGLTREERADDVADQLFEAAEPTDFQ